MPCYSTIRTKLIDAVNIEKAAKSLGFTVSKEGVNQMLITNGRSNIALYRSNGKSNFDIVGYAGNFRESILEPLLQGYAKEQLKALARKTGYVLEMTKPGEYILVGQE